MPRRTKQPPPTEAYYHRLGYVTVKLRLRAEAADAMACLVEQTGLGKAEVVSAALVAHRQRVKSNP